MHEPSNQLMLLATVVLRVCKQLVESVAITHKTSLNVANSGVQNCVQNRKPITKLEPGIYRDRLSSSRFAMDAIQAAEFGKTLQLQRR